MDQSQLRAFEARCIQEEAPACQTWCPLHVEAREFATLMAREQFTDARKLLDRTMPLSSITARLCSGPCVAGCRRAELDGGVNMPLLEKTCVSLTSSKKPFPLPGSGKKVAVAGSGLSSLAFAYETAKKGHEVQIFHNGEPGGRLKALSPSELPPEALTEALGQLEALRVRFTPLSGAITPEWADEILSGHLALYLGLDDPDTDCSGAGLEAGPDGGLALNALTLETSNPKIFAGGHADSFIEAVSDGKKAASSVDRFMQGVAPGTARDKDGVFPSKLFTNLDGYAAIAPVAPADPMAPTQEEAVAEAKRCIRCECMECVKNCAYLRSFKGYPKKYAREIYNNMAVVQGTRTGNNLINSCAECGLCASICPNDADTGAFCATAREEMVRLGHMPPSAHEFALEDMAYTNAPDIAFVRHQPGRDSSAWMFFPGCQLPASMPGETEALYAHLCANLEGGVGLYFACCGAPADWGGRRADSEKIAAAIRDTWQKTGGAKIILACSSCLRFFDKYLGDLPFEPLWTLLPELPMPQNATAAEATLALHDPCASRDFPSSQAGARKLLEKLGQKLEELKLGRGDTRCCGYGGLADQANPALGREFARDRADDSANPMLSYCSMCRDRIRAVGKESVHLLSLLFPAGGAFDLRAATERPAPGISARQEGRLLFREHMLKTLWRELPVRNKAMESIKLIVTDEAAPKLEARRVLHNEIKKVLLHEGSTQFRNPATGRSLACFKPKNVTYWVEYSRDGEVYIIHDAYCHRMTVPGVPEADLNKCAGCDGCSNSGPNMGPDMGADMKIPGGTR